MKKMKKIMAAAIAMMTFSTAAAVTGTVAWFTANNIVAATGMNIQAETEEGILISNEAKSDWKTSAVASHNSAVSVIPTSTADANTWYRNNSNDEDVATGSGIVGTYKSYADATDVTVTDGLGTIDHDDNADTAEKGIYLLNKFYLKSSINEAQTKPLYINKVDISGDSVDLHKAVRVLIKYGSTVKIYGLNGRTASYGVNGAASGVETITEADPVNTQLAASVSIPANNTTTPLEISVYCYFEGEDANCTSTNANATNALNTLAVALEFGTVTTA